MPILCLLEAALAVALALLTTAQPAADSAPLVDGVHVLAPPAEQDESWFVLEVGRVGPDGRERPEIVGLACLRRSVVAAGPRLEAEFRYPRAGARVLIVEEPSPAGRRMVYRELMAGAGRSLVIDELPEGGYSLLEWGGPEKRSGPLGCRGALVFPLVLVEDARAGRVRSEPFESFDPLSASPIRLRGHLDPVRGEPEDVYEVRYERDDGTLAATYRIRSGRVVEFQWQRGGPRARLATRREAAEAERRLRSSGPG